MRKSLAVLIPFVSATAIVAACSSNKPNPPVTPTVTPDAGLDDGSAMVDAAAPAPDAAAVSTGPTFFTGDAGAPGAPAVTDQAIDMAIDLAVTTAAVKVAPKMDKEGQPGRATLKEGEHFAMMVTLAPNRCYTFVGFSPPGSIEKLDVKLYGPPFFNVEAGKSGAADKAMPVIGKGAAALCPIVPIAVPYKLDIVATKGTGRMGVHIFARNK